MKGFVFALTLGVLLVAGAIVAQAGQSDYTMAGGSGQQICQTSCTPTNIVTGLPTVNQVLRANVGPVPSMVKVASPNGYGAPLGAGPSNADFYWNF
jgi:hypothetical protein